MGGTALNFKTRRIESRKEYTNLFYNIVAPGLSHIFPGCIFDLIPSYTSKESFGDMDILLTKNEYLPTEWRDMVKEFFKPKSTYPNGTCFSFDVEDFQIDLILTSEKEQFFSYMYYAYNDLGNFIGRTAHRLGFKYGHDGLWYVLRDPENPDRTVAELLITLSHYDAMRFLGYNPLWSSNYFDTPDEIYEFVTTSEYFDPRQFLLSNRNYTSKVRDRKRKMYRGMLEYIKIHYPDITDDTKPLPCNRLEHLERAFKQFPQFKVEYDEALAKHECQKALKQKFNGVFVASCFSVPPVGKELGVIMRHIRMQIEKYKLEDLILDMNEEQLYHLFYNVLLHNFFNKGNNDG